MSPAQGTCCPPRQLWKARDTGRASDGCVTLVLMAQPPHRQVGGLPAFSPRPENARHRRRIRRDGSLRPSTIVQNTLGYESPRRASTGTQARMGTRAGGTFVYWSPAGARMRVPRGSDRGPTWDAGRGRQGRVCSSLSVFFRASIWRPYSAKSPACRAVCAASNSCWRAR